MADFGDFCIYIGGRGGFPSPLQNKFVTKSPIIISKDFHIIQCDVENLKGIENKNI